MLSRARTSLTTALNVRPDEGQLLLLLLLLFFLKGICDVSVVTTASALFLSQFESTSLPYIYIASAAVVTIVGLAYSSLATRLSVTALFKIIVAFTVATLGVFHFSLLGDLPSRWWVMGLMVWREVVYMLLNVTFWAQVALLFNVRQGKRLFPLIAAGDIGSTAIGGAVIPFIVGKIGALHLLLFAEVSTALCVVVGVYISRAAKGATTEPSKDIAAGTQPLSYLLRGRYVALFFVLSIISFLIYFFVDYSFYDVVNSRYQKADQLAAFFGVFYAVLNGLNFVLNGVTSRVLARYGIYAGLLVLPLFVGVGAITAIVLPVLGVTAAIFWSVIGMKLMDEMLRGAFLIPTVKVLYQPLPDRERIRLQSLRESVVEPLAIGLSGIVLLALTQLAGFAVPQLLYVLVLIIAAFIGVCVFLRREYVSVLGKGLPVRTPVNQVALSSRYESLDDLYRNLESSNSEEVIQCFNLIDQADSRAAKALLPRMLKHALPEVRLYGVRWVQKSKDVRAAGLIRSLIEREESADVKSEALTTLSILTAGQNPPA